MANNKKFMDYIRNEVGKKNLTNNQFVRFALTNFDDASMKVCWAINSNDKDSTAKYLTELEIKMRDFVGYAWAMKLISTDELLKYKAKIDNFAKKELNSHFKEVA